MENHLGIAKENYVTVAKALERFQKEGLIKKISKGIFYKPENTVFVELKPDYNDQLKTTCLKMENALLI